MAFLHVKRDDNLKRRFKTACAAQDRQMGEVVAELIREWLQKTEANPTPQQTSEKKTQESLFVGRAKLRSGQSDRTSASLSLGTHLKTFTT